MRALSIVSVLAATALVACSPQSPPPGPIVFRTDSGVDAGARPARDSGMMAEPLVIVQAVIDGDTLRLSASDGVNAPDGRPLRGSSVRMLGVDAPEIAKNGDPGDCWGDESHTAARNLMQGLRVKLDFGSSDLRDRFDRLLAYVELPDGRIANEVLIQEGNARSFGAFSHRELSRYDDLEDEAKAAGKGLWSGCP